MLPVAASSALRSQERPEGVQDGSPPVALSEHSCGRAFGLSYRCFSSAAGGGCFAPQRCTLSWPLSVDDRRIPPFSPCPIFCYFGSDPKAGKGDSTVLFIRYVAGRSLRRTPSAGLRGRRLRPARRRGAAGYSYVSSRHNRADACFCTRLFVLWLRRRYSRPAMFK